VDAAVADVAVGQPLHPVPALEVLERAEVVAEALGRHRGILPAGPRGVAVGGAAGETDAVFADAPERPRLGACGHDAGVVGRCGAHDLRRLGECFVGRGTRRLDEEPRSPGGQRGHGAVMALDDLDEVAVHALDRERTDRQQRRDVVGRRGHVGVAEHDECGGGRDLDERHRRLEQDAARPLGAHERLREVAAVLGQQVLERVARHLAAEAAELGADGGEVARDERLELGVVGEARGGLDDATGAVDHPQRAHVVDRATPLHGARAARVVADHAADRAPCPGRRVGAEAQPVRRGEPLQLGHHDTRLHARGLRDRVDVEHAVQVPREVEHPAGSDRVAGDARARAARRERCARRSGGLDDRDDVGLRRGEEHRLGHDAVVGGVGGVLRAAAGGVIHLAVEPCAQLLEGVGARRGGQSHRQSLTAGRTSAP
jgi:hypothetical protein